MPTKRFEVPDDLTKVLAKTTIANYKSHLNKLAAEGYTTRDDLIKHQVDVVKLVVKLSGKGDTDSSRYKRRVFLSSIFWILNETPNDKKKAYYDSFQTAKTAYEAPK
jgi:hypothetical protein